jgi:TonB family protein
MISKGVPLLRLFGRVLPICSFAGIAAGWVQAQLAPTGAQLAPTPVEAGETMFPTEGPILASVSLLATVESDGHVSKTQIVDSIGSTLSGEPYRGSLMGYVEDSIAAVTQWRFSPTIDVNFKHTRSVASVTFIYDRNCCTDPILPIMRTIFPTASGYLPALPSIVSRVPSTVSGLRFTWMSIMAGTVVLNLHIDEKGSISEVEVIKSIPSLDEPSLHAARNWHFRPARYDGKPIRSTTTVAFVFLPVRTRLH